MSTKKGYILGILIGLLALAIVIVISSILARTTETSYSYAIIGVFLVSTSLFLGALATYLPKADIRRRAFIVCAIASAFAGIGCLFFGVTPSEIQRKHSWIPMLLGFCSFASFQILVAYLFVKVRRRQRCRRSATGT
jgi:cell division protein FtsW (lipid II flippase)